MVVVVVDMTLKQGCLEQTRTSQIDSRLILIDTNLYQLRDRRRACKRGVEDSELQRADDSDFYTEGDRGVCTMT